MREAMLAAFAAGVRAVSGEQATAGWLRANPSQGPVAVIALGKAAGAMARGAQAALGARLEQGLVIAKAGHADADGLDPTRFRIVEGSHPVPDALSLAAGQSLLEFIDGLSVDQPVYVLVSGGASALVEVLADGVTLDRLGEINRWLLANGLPIGQMNAVRRRLSRVKGGGLAALLAPRPVTGLLISDVEGDDPAVIGSGPLVPPPDDRLPDGLPDWLLDVLPAQATGSGQGGDPGRTSVQVIACLDDALAAAARQLEELGIPARWHRQHFDGSLDAVSAAVNEALRSEPGVVHLWGGEATVILPAQPGRGGRNQQLALQLARDIAGEVATLVLSAGTDGTDGPTGDAGALVDNQTVERGEVEGLSLTAHLDRADAGTYLEQTGDLLTTGPTGTNVTDLVMAWREIA
jgi:hydroxypyruvate reductase